jgi:F0F1-type ATP synthase assembly protein I
MENPEKPKEPKKQLNDYARYSGMAVQMIAIILIGVLGGIKLDEFLSLKFPVFTLVLTLLSVFLAMFFAIRDFLKK